MAIRSVDLRGGEYRHAMSIGAPKSPDRSLSEGDLNTLLRFRQGAQEHLPASLRTGC